MTATSRAARTATRVVLALLGAGAALAVPLAVVVIIADNASHDDMWDGLAAGLATITLAVCGVVLLLVVSSWRLVARDRPLGYWLAMMPGLLLLYVAVSTGVQVPDTTGATVGLLGCGLLLLGGPLAALLSRGRP